MVYKYNGVIQDITSKKLAEFDAFESERRLKAITDNIQGLVQRYVLYEDGTSDLLYISKGVEKINGFKAEQIIEDPSIIWNQVYEDDLVDFQNSILLSAKEMKLWDYSWRIHHPDGYTKWLRGTGYPIKDPKTNAVIWDTIILDISDGIKLEQALQKSEERLEAAILGADLGVWDFNFVTNESFVNDSWFTMLGYDPEVYNYSAEFFISILHPDDREIPNEQIERIENGDTNNIDCIIRLKAADGSYRVIHDRGRCVEYDKEGKAVRLIGTHFDITEQFKLQEEIENSLAEKTILLSEIHHRVKNNLAIVSGLLDLQAMEAQDDVLVNTLKDMGNRIKSIAGVHEQLYQGKSFIDIQLDHYIENLLKEIKSAMPSIKEISYDLSIKDSVKININQAVPIGLLLNELITNSFKYAFNDINNPKITFKMVFDGEKFNALYSDNGPGIAQNNMDNPKTLGFTLINTLLHQLDAEFSLDNSNGFKLEFSFFPNDGGSQANINV